MEACMESLLTLIDILLHSSVLLLSIVINYWRTGYRSLGVGLWVEEVGVKRQAAALRRRGRRCHIVDMIQEHTVVPDKFDLPVVKAARKCLMWEMGGGVEALGRLEDRTQPRGIRQAGGSWSCSLVGRSPRV